MTGRWLTAGGARPRWLWSSLVVVAACGGPQKLGDAGATCFRDDDCKAGLICVAPTAADSRRVCSGDPTSLISMVKGPDYGGMAGGGGAAAGSGGAATAGAAGAAPGGNAGGGAAGMAGVGGTASTGGKGGTAGSGGMASAGTDAAGNAGSGGTGTGGSGGSGGTGGGSGGIDAGGAP